MLKKTNRGCNHNRNSVIQSDEEIRIVLLANQPRMFRQMLRRALDRDPKIQMTLETDDPTQITNILNRVRADWLIVSLSDDSTLPAVAEDVAKNHPAVSILGISSDGDHVEIETRNAPGEDRRQRYALDNISLSKLLLVLNEVKGAEGVV